MQDADVFRVGGRLHAERAADVEGPHPQPLRLDLEHVLGERAAQAEHPLAARVKREALGRGIVVGNRRARLHRRDHDAVVDQLQPGDVRRPGKGPLRGRAVAEAPVETEVGMVAVQLRGIGRERLQDVRDRRQRLDVELDQFGRVLGGVRAQGDHQRQRLADVAHPPGREHRSRRREQRAAVLVLERQLAEDRAVVLEVGGGVNPEHAGRAGGGSGIDGAQHAMGVGRAQDHRICLARQVDVVGVAAMARDQIRVFLARDRLADAEFHGRQRVVVHVQALPRCDHSRTRKASAFVVQGNPVGRKSRDRHAQSRLLPGAVLCQKAPHRVRGPPSRPRAWL